MKNDSGFSLKPSQAAIDEFLNPSTVDIGEILHSSSKRRVSVNVTVCQVGHIEEPQTKKQQQNVTLIDSGDRRADLKLWGNKCNPNIEVGDKVTT